MTVIERCKVLREALIKRNDLIREAKQAETFSERAQEIHQRSEALSHSIDRLRVLREHGLLRARPRDSAAAQARLRAYLQQLEQAPSESGAEHGHARRSLDALCKSLTETADEALKDVLRNIPATEESLLKQLETHPAYKEKVTAIRSLRDELRRESNTAFKAEELHSFLNKRETLIALSEDLKADSIPKEVLEFYKAARLHGAPLEKLTATVRNWLTERDELGYIRVFFVEP